MDVARILWDLGFDRMELEDINKAAKIKGESIEEFIFEACIERSERILEEGAAKTTSTEKGE